MADKDAAGAAKLYAAHLLAKAAASRLAQATLDASAALTAVAAAFDEAGCSDAELDVAILAARRVLATTHVIDEALELAADCCDSLAADLMPSAPEPFQSDGYHR
jgi:hypothetical protein